MIIKKIYPPQPKTILETVGALDGQVLICHTLLSSVYDRLRPILCRGSSADGVNQILTDLTDYVRL